MKPSDSLVDISLKDKMILIPSESYINLDYVLEQLSKEEVVRQLPIYRKIFTNDVWRVNIEVCEQLYLLSKEKRQRIDEKEWERFSALLQKGVSVHDFLPEKEA